LHLLERQARRVGYFRLAFVEHEPTPAEPASDVLVYGVNSDGHLWPPAIGAIRMPHWMQLRAAKSNDAAGEVVCNVSILPGSMLVDRGRDGKMADAVTQPVGACAGRLSWAASRSVIFLPLNKRINESAQRNCRGTGSRMLSHISDDGTATRIAGKKWVAYERLARKRINGFARFENGLS
jgi:hypothetical protein